MQSRDDFESILRDVESLRAWRADRRMLQQQRTRESMPRRIAAILPAGAKVHLTPHDPVLLADASRRVDVHEQALIRLQKCLAAVLPGVRKLDRPTHSKDFDRFEARLDDIERATRMELKRADEKETPLWVDQAELARRLGRANDDAFRSILNRLRARHRGDVLLFTQREVEGTRKSKHLFNLARVPELIGATTKRP